MAKTDQPTTKSPPPKTIREGLTHINTTVRNKLPNKDADTIRIMEFVVGLNETGILQSLDKKLTTAQVKKLSEVTARIQKQEPLEYIVGSGDFHGRRFYVSTNTLIPRAETETLVDLTVGYAKEKLFCENYCSTSSSKKPKLAIVDVGTGTGCIIVSTALQLREPAAFYATDISKNAIIIAQKNISAYKLKSKINTFEGNLLDPIDEKVSFDIIVANLPYIQSVEIESLIPSVKDYEPETALDGGKNGAKVIRELLVQGTDRLNTNGIILLEVQPKIISTVTDFATRFYPKASIEVQPDMFKTDRYLVIRT